MLAIFHRTRDGLAGFQFLVRFVPTGCAGGQRHHYNKQYYGQVAEAHGWENNDQRSRFDRTYTSQKGKI